MISLILAEKIFSLFLIMFMGYAVVHWGLLHAEDSKTLSLISLYLISPCVIISAFQVQYTPDVLHGLLLALAAAVLLHVGIIVVVNLLGHALHLDAVEKASMIYSNAGNLIIPIVTAVLGKEWVIYSSAFLSVQLFLLWSHAKSMLCGEKSFELKKVLTNINMIAILAGAALFLLHIQLPAVIEDSLDMVGSAIGPISMIILGMLMAGMNFKKILGYRRLWLVTALRLVGIPLAAEVFSPGVEVLPAHREYQPIGQCCRQKKQIRTLAADRRLEPAPDNGFFVQHIYQTQCHRRCQPKAQIVGQNVQPAAARRCAVHHDGDDFQHRDARNERKSQKEPALLLFVQRFAQLCKKAHKAKHKKINGR